MAVILLESSTEFSSSLMKRVNPLQTAFPTDPMAEYTTRPKVIFTGLA